MTDLLGQTIGNYRIEALLGRGGMGQVFRARHLRLDRLAAIKIVHGPLAADPSFRARFQQEARTAAALTHPHIVTIYDFGEQDARAFLAMELIEGGSLRDRLRLHATSGQGWPLTTSLELIRQAADALAFAHAHGMVHRDIKPDNLLLAQAEDSSLPTLKVGDFGLARLIDGVHLTATGTAMGTPAYMSPEQCQGRDLDGRSDLYSLGVVLYELATGRVPFAVKTAYDAVYQHVNTPPPSPRLVRPELPPALETLILRCLAKLPSQRFTSMAEFATLLTQLLASPGAELGTEIVPLAPTELFAGLGPTVVQPAAGGQAPPLAVETLVATAYPTLRVFDAAGQPRQVVELRASELSVGRAPDNALVLEGEGVSRHHLTLRWDGQVVQLTDLGSANGTRLDGQALTPSAPQLWPWRAQAQVGSFLLRLEPPISATQPAPRTRALGAEATASFGTMSLSGSLMLSERLELRLEQAAVALTPGQPTLVRVTLINRGPTPDLLTLTVSGVPDAWVSGGSALLLQAGESSTATLTVLVPADSEIAAGDRLVKVRARSKERPAEGAQAEGRWTILPFQAVSLSLTPARASARSQASYRLSVRNTGNASARYQLSADDESGALRYELLPSELELAAGQEASVRVQVADETRLSGASLARRFSVQATAADGSAAQASASGQFVHLALVPTWTVPAAIGLLMLVLACGFLPPATFGSALAAVPFGFLQPRVASPTPTSSAAAGAGQAATDTAIVIQNRQETAVAAPLGTQQALQIQLAQTITAVAQAAAAANATASVVTAQSTADAEAANAASTQNVADAAGAAQQATATVPAAGARNPTAAATEPPTSTAVPPTATAEPATATPTEEPTEEPTETLPPTRTPVTVTPVTPTKAPVPLAVSSMSPASGLAAGGTVVTIAGTGFSITQGGTTVTFGSKRATNISCQSTTQCTATSPAGIGTVDVRVTVAGQTSAASANDRFTYISPPTVTNISPATGPAAGGTIVTITGTGFGPTQITTITFGTNNATSVSCANDAQCTATSPTGKGIVDVRVIVAGQQSAIGPTDRFTYIAPTVTNIAPSIGPGTGGTDVTIIGTGFSTIAGATTVRFGNTNATNVSCSSETQCTVTSPAGTGTVDVRVTVAGQQSATSAADRFTYSAPTVTSISPNNGPAAGGTDVTISGTGFSTIAGATTVWFGNTDAINVMCPTDILCTAITPAGAPGVVDVHVTVAGQQSAVNNNDRYKYN